MTVTISGNDGVSKCQPGSVSAGDFFAGAINPATDITYTQTWQDVIGSRAIGGGPYTNSTGQPIKVAISGAGVAGAAVAQIRWATSSVIRGYAQASTFNGTTYSAMTWQLYFEVPVGATYQIDNHAGTNTLFTWMELR